MKIFKNKNLVSILLSLLLLYEGTGCKKLLKVDLPSDKISSEIAYANTASAVAVITGIYTNLSSFDGALIGRNSPSIAGSLLSDELQTPFFVPEYRNAVTSENSFCVLSIWDNSYRKIIYRVNAFIEGVSASNGIPEVEKEILLGEAKFIRALIYFNLVNFWGDVPLVLTTDFKTNSNLPRSSENLIYAQIISDLLDAQQGLSENYLHTDLKTRTTERVRPNKAAATAMLARVYLYTASKGTQMDWSKAELEATKIIEDSGKYEILPLDEVFLKNSRETIWAIQPTRNEEGANTPDGRIFINPYHNPPDDNLSLSPFLLKAFENGDLRKTQWTTTVIDFASNEYIVPYKYKAGRDDQDQKEYNIMLRLSEQYLIRAEARMHIGNVEGAKHDLNIVRYRAGLTGISTSDSENVLNAIAHERYVELFTESGHRWFDLKRSGNVSLRMAEVTPEKGGSWLPYKALMPISRDEILMNKALKGHQNAGYDE